MEVKIVYSSLEEAAEYFDKAAGKCKSYKRDAESVVDTIKNLPGSDTYGYVNSALKSAREKANKASDLEARCGKISAKIESFKEYAKTQDKNAASSINTTITNAVGERSFFQKLGDWIHDSYVNFLDKLESLGPVGKLLAKWTRKATDWVGETYRKAKNYFKYGNGKYLLNILDGIKDVLLAVGMLVAAVAAIVTGPIWIVALGIIGVVASGIYLICTMVDANKQIDSNAKAWSLSKDGNITAARYYGEIDGWESYAEHYDYGDASDNKTMSEITGKFSLVKTVSKVVSKVSSLALSFGTLGLTQNADGKEVFDIKRAFQGRKFVNENGAGFYSNDYQTGGFDAGKAFNPLDNIFKTKNSGIFNKILAEDNKGLYKITGYVLDGAKWESNLEKIIGGGWDLVTGETSGYETVENIMDLVGFVPILDEPSKDIWTVVDNGKSIIGLFGSGDTETNAYMDYLNKNPAAGTP